jgi:hypothetical protein
LNNIGARRGYTDGCRCNDCKDAQRLYQQRYRERSLSPVTNVTTALAGPGPVESGVQAEIGGSAAEARPGLAQMALAMARILDSKAVNQQPAAAKVLASLLDKCTKPGRPVVADTSQPCAQ